MYSQLLNLLILILSNCQQNDEVKNSYNSNIDRKSKSDCYEETILLKNFFTKLYYFPRNK